MLVQSELRSLFRNGPVQLIWVSKPTAVVRRLLHVITDPFARAKSRSIACALPAACSACGGRVEAAGSGALKRAIVRAPPNPTFGITARI